MTAVQYTFILCLPRKGWAMAPLSGIDLGSCRLGIRIRGYARGTETAAATRAGADWQILGEERCHYETSL